MFNKLKNFAASRYDINELVELSAYARALRLEYEALGVEVPDDIDHQIKAVRREISDLQRDAIAARRQSIRSRIDALKSPDQKRKELEEELAKLDQLQPA